MRATDVRSGRPVFGQNRVTNALIRLLFLQMILKRGTSTYHTFFSRSLKHCTEMEIDQKYFHFSSEAD